VWRAGACVISSRFTLLSIHWREIDAAKPAAAVIKFVQFVTLLAKGVEGGGSANYLLLNRGE
jgi:hypothetical protein